MKYSSSLKLKRSAFLFSGYTSDYELQIELGPFSVPSIVDAATNEILAPIFSARDSLVEDLKGVDASSITSYFDASERPIGEEILFLSGQTFDEDGGSETQTFQIHVLSAFDSFKGSSHIVHRISTKRSGSIPSDLPMRVIGRVFPLKIERYRMGLEVFHSGSIAGLFGLSPSVTESFSIDGDEESLELKIHSESLKKRDDAPLGKLGLFNLIDNTFVKALGFSVRADYQKQLSANKEN